MVDLSIVILKRRHLITEELFTLLRMVTTLITAIDFAELLNAFLMSRIQQVKDVGRLANAFTLISR